MSPSCNLSRRGWAAAVAAVAFLATSTSAFAPHPESSFGFPLADRHVIPSHAQSRYRRVVSSWRKPRGLGASDPTVRPTDFGADPTGVNDSTAAFNSAMAAVLAHNTSGHKLAFGVQDLGGVTLDLSGGDYLISAPLVFPVFVGNFRVIDGTLRASSTFPRDRWLVEVGDEKACQNGQGSCNENAGFEGVFFDSNQIASGGLRISATMGANVGPQCFFLNFTTSGVQLDGGHEVMVHESWFGEFLYSDSRKENGTASTAIAVLINGNDHIVSNVIVFSSKIGVQVNGGANLIENVHTWNLALSNGGIGIDVAASQTRLTGVYLDWNDLQYRSAQSQTLLNSFFLCGGHVVFAPQSNTDAVAGVSFVANEFWCLGQKQNQTITYNTSNGSYSNVADFTVTGTVAEAGFQIRSPTATRVVTSAQPTTSFTIDFSDVLAFDTATAPIQSVQYSITLPSGVFARHAARPANGASVTVETDTPVTGSVSITVDQSKHSV
jgi:hypothetical protein